MTYIYTFNPGVISWPTISCTCHWSCNQDTSIINRWVFESGEWTLFFKTPMSLECNKITCSLIQCQNRETYTDKLHIAPGISALRLKKVPHHISSFTFETRCQHNDNISPRFGRLSRQCLQEICVIVYKKDDIQLNRL